MLKLLQLEVLFFVEFSEAFILLSSSVGQKMHLKTKRKKNCFIR